MQTPMPMAARIFSIMFKFNFMSYQQSASPRRASPETVSGEGEGWRLLPPQGDRFRHARNRIEI
jgi:hypothetical protein